MKKLLLSACGLLAGIGLSSAQTITQWTFETSQPAGAPPAGVTITNIAAEVGLGTASGLHAGAATYSSPAGDASAHSFSANTWAVGDFFQFQTSSLGYTGLQLDWDQISSSTGPGTFKLQWSTDGSSYTTLGSDYSILVNASPNTWTSTGSYVSASHYTVNLSSVLALNNAGSVYFRLVDDATTTPSGGTVAAGGTDRVDNFTVSVAPVPEPASLALLGLGLTSLLAFRRRE